MSAGENVCVHGEAHNFTAKFHRHCHSQHRFKICPDKIVKCVSALEMNWWCRLNPHMSWELRLSRKLDGIMQLSLNCTAGTGWYGRKNRTWPGPDSDPDIAPWRENKKTTTRWTITIIVIIYAKVVNIAIIITVMMMIMMIIGMKIFVQFAYRTPSLMAPRATSQTDRLDLLSGQGGQGGIDPMYRNTLIV